MGYKHMVEIGRVVMINSGPNAGKAAAIVDVIDQNRALIDSPQVDRQGISFNRIRLTKYKIKIPFGTSSKVVNAAWEKEEIEKKFNESTLKQRLLIKQRRAELTDLERFKLYKVKQRINRLVDDKFRSLKDKDKKERKAKKLSKKVARKPRTVQNKKKKAKRLARKEALKK